MARGARQALRIPLAAKLVGANVAVAILALSVVVSAVRSNARGGEIISALGGALLVGVAVSALLTWLALRPIREIERTIRRVWRGQAEARVIPSPIADPNLTSIAETLNALLDHLERGRAHMRELASEVIRAGDQERERVGLELRESISQSAAAVILQISALLNVCHDPVCVARLGELRILAGQVLEQLDELSHSVHPRVLNDLGLVAGLRRLAREVATDRNAVDVRVIDGTETDLRGLGREVTSALYRIAQEAVQNAIRHGNAANVRVDVDLTHDVVSLSILDDGVGFDVQAAEGRRPGMGLFTMRQRASLIDASFRIDSKKDAGSVVRVSLVPGPATLPSHEILPCLVT